jgi:MscS family membrane protein
MGELMFDWILHNLKLISWREIVVTSLVLLTAWVASRIYVLLVDKIGRRLARQTASDIDDRILEALRRPGAILVFLIGVYAAFHRYKFRVRGHIDNAMYVVAVVVILWGFMRVLGILLVWHGEKLSTEKKDETIARQLLPLTNKIFRIVIAAIGLVIILEHFGIRIQSILVSLGVGSLAVGLALQDTLANMFGGFTIMLDRPFRVGERIQLQTGELGDVQYIGMRSTTVLMPDSNTLIIPNALLVKTIVINHSFPDNRLLIKVELKVAYDSNTEMVKEIMRESAVNNPRILPVPAPEAYFNAFGDSALHMILFCYVKSFQEKAAAIDALNTDIAVKFKAAAIEIAPPSRTVFLTAQP